MSTTKIPERAPAALQPVLCVSLDGTLLHTDLAWESALTVIRRSPSVLLLVPFWLLRGTHYLRQRLAERAQLDVATLPYRDEVVEHVRAARSSGRRTVLSTAGDRRLAQQVADHLGLFDTVVAADHDTGVTGATRLQAIEAFCSADGFDYIGSEAVDLPMWRSATSAWVVAPSPGLRRRLRARLPAVRELGSRGPWHLPQALRVHQWSKNLLVFVPVVLAHRLDAATWLLAAAAALAFSLVASSVYILNDLLDLPHDRLHPRKRDRPLAAGHLPPGPALLAGAGCATLGLLIAAGLPAPFLLVLMGYLLLTTSYSWKLKNVLLVDVFVLAALYTARLLAGSVATGVVLSPWLLAFSICLFLSLAFLKRFSELSHAAGRNLRGRRYREEDLGMIRSVGPAAGYAATVVVLLYISSEDVTTLYENPAYLWLIPPLLLYWITRLWFFAARGVELEDPVVFATRDRVSFLVAAAMCLVIIAAAV